MTGTMSSSSSSFSPLLPFFILLAVVPLFIGVNAVPESSIDYTSAFVEQKKTEVTNVTNVTSKVITDLVTNDKNDKEDEDDDEDEEDEGDEGDDEEEDEDEEEDSSRDGGAEENEDEEMEGEYEGEERDEYEDELKALVESHEAMSKDKTKEEVGRNSNVSSKAPNSSPKSESDAKNFESQENVLEKQSDEDVASNEAIIDELPIKHEDKEVADLLKYKKEKISHKTEESDLSRKKKKRVPTVKKELSTQKEIILAGNETQVPKSLVPSEETFNVLNDDNDSIQRRDLEGKEPSQHVGSQRVLDKRHKTLPRNMKACSTKECVIEQEEERNIIELKDEEGNEVKSSSNFRKRYQAEGFERWDVSRNHFSSDSNTGLEERKPYDINSTVQVSVDDSQKDGKKPKKKKKKKKKKKTRPQQRRSVTTELPISTTSRTTTETEPETTTAAIQWHLLAEKWFGPSWQQDVRPESENVAKIHYSITSKPETVQSSSSRGTIDRQDSSNVETKSDMERPSSSLQKSSNLDGRSNLFPFGKTTSSHRNIYDLEADRLRDYEPPERVFQRLRFGEIGGTSPRDFGLRDKNPEDYRDDTVVPLEEEFAHNREYRPPSQDFAMTRNWPGIPTKYDRRLMQPRLSNDWAWRQPPLRYDVDFWPTRGKTWQPYRDYWTPHVDPEETDDPEIDRNWRTQERWQRPRAQIRQRQRQRQRQRLRQRLRQENDDGEQRLPYSPWELDGGGDVWPMSSKPFQLEPPWPRIKDHIYESTKPVTATATSTTTSTTTRLNGKDKMSLPKISMTTWNSLTSDPATWPYKSSGTKPWPKDENGKSYNPNADLVRKLGLDKDNDDTIWSKGKSEKTYDDSSFDRRSFLDISVKNSTQEEDESEVKKYKLPKVRMPEFNIYDVRPRMTKDWTKLRNGEVVPRSLDSSNDEINGWYHDDEESRKTLSNGLPPELRTVGGWVMPPDKSTWLPYRYEPLNAYESVNEIESWPRRATNVDVWDRKDSLSRIGPNLVDPWPSRFQNDHWNTDNYPMWDRKRSFDRGQPEDVDVVKTNRVEIPAISDSLKTNDSNVVIKENLTAKSNNWNTSDEKSGSWSSRWKQFSYHRVTSLPTSKPGTISNTPSKSKNAFVAVSVLSSPKYLGTRNDIEDSSINRNDPFERQLEDLRRQRFWGTKTDVVEESNRSTRPTMESTTTETTTLTTLANSTLEERPKSTSKEYEMHLRI